MTNSNKDTLIEIGRSLTESRQRRGYTLQHAAELLGISVKTLRSYEHGERQMTVRTAAKIAIQYGTTMTKLLGIHIGDGDVQPKDVKLHGYKYIRKSMAMTQAEFAVEIGVSRGSLANYETGKTDMPVTAFIRLCTAGGLSDKEVNELVRHMIY